MPTCLLVAAAILAALDASLRVWTPARAWVVSNLVFLAIAWVPFFVLPHVGTPIVALWAATIGVLAFVDYARMVGLSIHGRYMLPALALIVGCFPLAAAHRGGMLAAVPVLAVLVFVTAGAAGRTHETFLQKLCLAWLAVLVYGYLYAHAVLFVDAGWPRSSPRGTTMLALVILLAKFANVAWLAARRVSGRTRIMLIAAPVGGAVGGLIVPGLWPALAIPALPAVSFAIGLGLGAGCRAHALIVADVTGAPEHQRKGTMLFGFGIALAVGYWAFALA
ncbi:MAG TPA: hypothetical protein VLA14_15235, partial [Polyangia bacterium]|nr:hypothetical protein [Polyangia bacterium]